MPEAGESNPFSNISNICNSNLELNNSRSFHIEKCLYGKLHPHGPQQQHQQNSEKQNAFVAYGHQDVFMTQTNTNDSSSTANYHHTHSDDRHQRETYTHAQNPHLMNQIASNVSSTTQDHQSQQVQSMSQNATNTSQFQDQRWELPHHQSSLVEQQQQHYYPHDDGEGMYCNDLLSLPTEDRFNNIFTTSMPATYPIGYSREITSPTTVPVCKERNVKRYLSRNMSRAFSSGSFSSETDVSRNGSKKRHYDRKKFSFISHYCQSPLDKAAFAPPPSNLFTSIPRIKIPGIQYGSATLPVSSRITHSGHLSARISPKSLLLKKWKPVFWVTYGDTQLLVFRSRVDFDEWMTNSYLEKEERDKIVKLRVNFRKGVDENLNVDCFRVSRLHSKDYGKSGKMFTCKLEKWVKKPITIGAFASSSEVAVGSFYTICNAMIDRQEYGLRHFIAEKRDMMRATNS